MHTTFRQYTGLTVLLLLVLAVMPVAATGLVEEPVPGSEEDGDTVSQADQTDVGGSQDAAGNSATVRARAPEYVPEVVYPETLFVRQPEGFGSNVDLAEFLAAMESDRRLLSEIRKGIPNTREEAELFLQRLKQLAGRSDPVRLAIRADRVLEQAPIYFDWLETEFETAEDATYEYYVGGAQGFQRAMDEFEQAALLIAINRLDTASRMLQAYAEDPSAAEE